MSELLHPGANGEYWEWCVGVFTYTGDSSLAATLGRSFRSREKVLPRMLSCGVIVTDGASMLLGHAARSPRWDIPKGLSEPGETAAETVSRELKEETGLEVAASDLVPLGTYDYLPAKDLALFTWRPAVLPKPDTLVCASTFTVKGVQLPEFDRFGLFSWD
jgi:8-oxo-dGTP pyrophosphatase MutT (NUDIX family)